MKKSNTIKFISLLLLSILYFRCLSQTIRKPSREDEKKLAERNHIKANRISSAKEIVYLYADGQPSQTGKLVLETKYDTAGFVSEENGYDNYGDIDNYTYKYNSNGQLMEMRNTKTFIAIDQKKNNNQSRRRTYFYYNPHANYDNNSADGSANQNTWRYDDTGKKIGDINLTGTFTTTFSFQYDKNGNLAEETWFTTKEKTEFFKNVWKSDNRGNKTEEKKYKSDNTNIQYNWKYDTLGYKIQEIETFSDNRQNKTTWKYDEKGNLLDEVTEKFDRNTVHKSCKYDSNSNMIEEANYDTDGKTIISRTQYKYDKNGLKTEGVFYNSMKVPKVLTKWEYSFFK
ncbi:MAG: hypothetical protein HY958_09310 [Bacteroidia bacterium]|nr:hypothetical protein [Bacteroidia bacterium]